MKNENTAGATNETGWAGRDALGENGRLPGFPYADPPPDCPAVAGKPPDGQVADADKQADALARLLPLLAERKFDAARIRRRPPATITFAGGCPFVTAGNLAAIFAQSGVGKTAVVGAILAAVFHAAARQTAGAAPGAEPDCLSFAALPPPDAARVFHFDTEQDPADADAVIRRAVKRAEIPAAPSFLDSYALAGFSAPDLNLSLKSIAGQIPAGKLHLVILDGGADFLASVNDEAECNAFIAGLHAFAIARQCAIVIVCHNNAGSDNPKGRGHLGSQLERKCETVLQLIRDKDNPDTTQITAIKTRHATPSAIPRFSWNNDAEMHLTFGTPTRAEIRAEKLISEYAPIVRDAFNSTGEDLLNYSELVAALCTVSGKTKNTISKKITPLQTAGIIRAAGAGKYALAT
ncbi:MAG: AAA family ATPase [Opitutaceae bacterium]|jgi:hypothetical protein|nr:AAA family ATPase [Opitutaceae bacterium]